MYKVATIGKPIVVVDCFAGPGKFDDGELGSPLIISEKLLPLHERDIKVLGFFVESDEVLYHRLQENVKNVQIPIKTRKGSFRDFIPEIANLAKSHTIFVYLDPIKPTDLLFDDLKSVYDHLGLGQSVETLINFMSRGFLRATLGLKGQGVMQKTHKSAIRWSKIAGGDYWHEIVTDETISAGEKTDELAKGYSDQLHKWFKWVLTYPVREKYEHEFPKYHLIFGSRYHQAVDIMNRAMVKARREFVGAHFIDGMLFDNQPEEEVVDPEEIKNVIIETSQKIGKAHWEILRAHATVDNPCMYTESEFDKAIKVAIKKGELQSDCDGSKIQQKALVWLV